MRRLKQLYYTSCPAGEGLERNGGYQVKAATERTTEAEMQLVSKHCLYDRVDPGPEGRSARDPPRRLAYVIEPRLGPILVHACDAGVDAAGRTGNFFAHALFGDTEAALDAHAALAAFASPFWRRESKEKGLTLPSVDWSRDVSIPPSPPPAKADQHDLENLLALLLDSKTTEPIIVAGQPEEIAGLLWVVTSLLPRRLRKGLTFSLYEKDPRRTPARVVGVLSAEPAGGAAPWKGRVAVDLNSGRRVTPPVVGAFVKEASARLAAGDLGDLKEFREVWELADPAASVDALYGAWLATRGSHPLDEASLRAALKDRAFERGASAWLVDNLFDLDRKAPQAVDAVLPELRGFGKAPTTSGLLEEGYLRDFEQAVDEQDVARLGRLRDFWLPLVADPDGLVERLAGQLRRAEKPAPSAIRTMLYAMAKQRGIAQRPAFDECLAASDPQEMEALVLSAGDLATQTRVLLVNLRRGMTPTPPTAALLARDPAIAFELLVHASADGKVRRFVLDSTGPELLDALLDGGRDPAPGWCEPLLDRYPRERALALLERHGKPLAARLTSSPALAALLTHVGNANYRLMVGEGVMRDVFVVAATGCLAGTKEGEYILRWRDVRLAREGKLDVASPGARRSLAAARASLKEPNVPSFDERLAKGALLFAARSGTGEVVGALAKILSTEGDPESQLRAWRLLARASAALDDDARVDALVHLFLARAGAIPAEAALTRAFQGNGKLDADAAERFAEIPKSRRKRAIEDLRSAASLKSASASAKAREAAIARWKEWDDEHPPRNLLNRGWRWTTERFFGSDDESET